MNLDLAPILVFWETTRACRLACRHCRAEAVEEPLPGELTTGESLRLLQQIAEFTPGPPVLVLTGGDMLMRADLDTLISSARSLGIHVAASPSVTPMLTNGGIDRLADAGIRAVSISLDGAQPETHERIRGVPGHFDQTIRVLRELAERGFRVQVNTTVMRDNVEELADVAGILLQAGVRIWEVFFLVRTGRGTQIAELAPDENEDVAHFLYDASRLGLVVRTVEGPFFRRVVAWRRERPPEEDAADAFGLGPLYRRLRTRLADVAPGPPAAARPQTLGTRDGRGILFVSYDGSIYPAGFLPLSLGNVRSDRITDVYRDDPMLRRIRAADFTGRCGSCGFRDLCGGSRARAFAMTGDPLGEDPACAYDGG